MAVNMKPVLTSEEMKKCEQYTIEQVGIPSLVLMEKAALFVCSRIKDEAAGKILIICGYGNNGADGLAAARILAGRGHQVQIVMVGREEKATKENQLQQHILEQLCISVKRGIDTVRETDCYEFVIDALFGIGLHRDLEGEVLKAVRLINTIRQKQGAKVIAVDLPSGLHADSGSIMKDAVMADETVTFQWKKTGMLLGKGPLCCGKTIVGDIGICKVDLAVDHYLVEDGDLLELPYRTPYGNKGTYGKILSVTGSETMAGAMVLSTQAAFRSGAGMVRVLSHRNNRQVLFSAVPEALFVDYDQIMNLDQTPIMAVEKMKEYFEWSTSLLIGCGLSKDKAAELLTEYVMCHYEKTAIVDGDALNIISKHLDWLIARKDKGYPTVLTPHPLEFSRLCGLPVEDAKHQDMDYCMHWAAEYGCILVLKDAVTLITDGKTVYISDSGTDALATAGSGDVLAGMIVMFAVMDNGSEGVQRQRADSSLAADMAVKTAVAVFVHGKAGCYAAEQYHRASVKAGDLPEMIPKVLKEGGI
ncbi:MAG: NAD(P)H-hydrate dehydratase [Lachnospiraceae bacterium]|nr:NAD(P)H-hydrate dehydratase [Lachnospiraceae bacterium]